MHTMQKFLILAIAAAFITLTIGIRELPTVASTVTLLNENFNNINAWKDMSTAVTWDGHPQKTSAFYTSSIGGGNNAVGLANGSLNDLNGKPINALTTNPYSASSLKGFSSLDLQFNQPINHATSTVTVEFRAKWDQLRNSSSGEGGRFMVILNHDYPVGGLDLTPSKNYNNFIANNIWARPAYHARIRSGNNSGSFAMLQYGGGKDADGEYERYDVGSNGTPDWWLPGFIQNAGSGSPGVGSPFPKSSWTPSVNGLASTNWQTFRYIIAPGVQELWRDTTGTGSFTREIRMPLPSSSTASLYKYFPELHGLRLYWRAGGTSSQVLVDYLKVTVAQ